MLQVRIGQHSEAGCKAVNQDFHGARVPEGAALAAKGVAVALADGIGSSDVSHIASATAVRALMDDYYSTSDAWSVRRAVHCVLQATNAWLHAQSLRGPHRFDRDRGHVCTLSALVLKAATAHLFHVGDARICRVQGRGLEQLTEDHRVHLEGRSYLGRALGAQPQVEIDYLALPVAAGDTFVLATDGVHEHASAAFIAQTIAAAGDGPDADLDAVARAIVAEALRCGSQDNLTVQILRIAALPQPSAPPARAALRLPPLLAPGQTLDGYRIVRELHASHRSHLYLAHHAASGEAVALKIPATDLQADPAQLDRFALEEWIARRVHSPHVLRPGPQEGPREHLFVALEYVQGQTLAQWMADHPRPTLPEVRGIVAQIARGLQAFHRMEMLHQDLRPENIMVDAEGTVKIIDFGAVHVAGLAEHTPAAASILGTVQYTAPEYFLGEAGTPRSDLFSLGVIAYQMLTGRLPYGTQVAGLRTRAALRRLRYASASSEHNPIPAWVDAVLERAVHPEPRKRQEALSEFVHDLHQPNAATLARARAPLAERNPLLFWRTLALLLALAVVALLGVLHARTP